MFFKCFKSKTVEEKIEIRRDKARHALLTARLALLHQEQTVLWHKRELAMLDKMVSDKQLSAAPPVVLQDQG